MKSTGVVIKGAAYFPVNRQIEKLNLEDLKLLEILLTMEFERRKLCSNQVDKNQSEKIKEQVVEDLKNQLGNNSNLIHAVSYLEEVKEAISEVSKQIMLFV